MNLFAVCFIRDKEKNNDPQSHVSQDSSPILF